MLKNGLGLELRKRILNCLIAGDGYRKIAATFGIEEATAKYIRDIYRRGKLSYFVGKETQVRYKASEKLALVEKFLASGLPLKTFARTSSICPTTFRGWVRKHREGTLLKKLA